MQQNARIALLTDSCADLSAALREEYAIFSLNTLEYLEKGGRIGKVTAVAGALLNIKPILTFAESWTAR